MMYAIDLNEEVHQKTNYGGDDWEVKVHLDGKLYTVDGTQLVTSKTGVTYLVIAINGERYERL